MSKNFRRFMFSEIKISRSLMISLINLVKLLFLFWMNIDEVQLIGFPNSFEKCHFIRKSRQNEMIYLHILANVIILQSAIFYLKFSIKKTKTYIWML